MDRCIQNKIMTHIKKKNGIKKFFSFFRKDKKINGVSVLSDETVEFRKNFEILTDEYGEDLRGLSVNYGTAKVLSDLLKRIKHLEER